MSTSFPQIDKSKYYTKTETHALLDALALGEYEFANAYYNKDYIDELGEQYYLKAEVDALIAAIEGGGGSAEYPDQTGNAGKFLSTDGTNVSWSTINTSLTNNSLRYITTGIYMTSGFPATGAFVNYLTTISPKSDIDPTQIVNTSTLKLLKGKTYKIDGGVEAVQASSGVFTISFRTYTDTSGTTLIDVINDTYSYINYTSARSYRAGGYIKPTEDCYLKLFVEANSLASGTSLQIEYTITEISTLGLPEMPAYKLGEEVLTSERWINGKPIYRKVIDFGTLPNNANKTVAHGVANVETIWLDRANSFVSDSSGYIYGLEAATSVVSANWYGTATATAVQIRTYTDRTTHTGMMTIRYTKTTDTASSPVAIIGGEGSREITLNGLSELPKLEVGVETLTSQRWIDGKPIYSITIDFGVVPNNTAKTVAIPNYDSANTYWIDMGNSWLKTPAGDVYPMIYFTSTTTQFMSRIQNSTGSVWVDADNSAFAGGQVYFTIRYTKATDTANSPVALVGSQYNITTNEYVLPYTRNGKAVYGMEVDFGTLPNATTKSVAIPNYNSSYKYIVSSDSYAYDPVNKSTRPLPSPHATNLIDLSISNGLIYITCSGNRSAFTESKVVLHYTKD